jgi:dienelactone hydrolase
MSADLFAPDGGEPLALVTREAETPAVFGAARCLRFEFSSRGDRVPGRLLLPDGDAAAPLVLLQHGAGGSKEAPYLDAAAPWVRSGVAVASIDFPLHGERANPKLGAELLRALAPGGAGSGQALVIEFVRQAVLDLRRALDALAALPGVDAERTAYAGFSLGGMLGALFCAADQRPRAAALALAGGGFGIEAVDPCRYVARLAPRPVLFVNATRDARVPRTAAEALHAAAAEPKRVEWFDATHAELPGVALKCMWLFLREAVQP